RAPQRHRRPCAPTRPTGRTGLVRAGRLRAGARRARNPAYLASLAESHAPTTIRRRLSAIGKMHRFNDLPWNPAHRDIQEPQRGLLRQHGRPPHKAAPLTLAMLRRLLATCDPSARGRRDRALLLFGFAGALRRSELVALHVEDVGEIAGGLRLRIARSKTDPTGQGAEIGLPRGKHAETCPARAFEAWQAVARRKAGPLFRGISSAGRIGEAALHPDAGDPGAARRHGGARTRGLRAAERTCAARRLHHRGLRQGRAGRGHHAPHAASRPAHHAWLRAARRPGDGKPGRVARSLMEIRCPWDADPPPPAPPRDDVGPKPRGRRRRTPQAAPAAEGWLYHHLTISGPADRVAAFAAAA